MLVVLQSPWATLRTSHSLISKAVNILMSYDKLCLVSPIFHGTVSPELRNELTELHLSEKHPPHPPITYEMKMGTEFQRHGISAQNSSTT